MLGFDAALAAKMSELGGFYRRYSDDILVACDPSRMGEVEAYVIHLIQEVQLTIQSAKTERVILAPSAGLDFQYLGFLMGNSHAKLRHKSLSKQWRSLRQAVRNTRRIGEKAIADGKSDKIYRRKVCVRFSDAGRRNFLSYASNAAETLQSPAIKKQIKKLRKFAQAQIASLKE